MTKLINNCEPANSIIEAFGGAKSIAKLLGLSANTPTAWRTKSRIQNDGKTRGTGGHIPHKYWKKIIDLGKERNLNIIVVYSETGDCIPYLTIKN